MLKRESKIHYFNNIDLANFHLAPPGSDKCDYGFSVDMSDCENAVLAFAVAAGSKPGRSLKVGSGGTCMDGSWGQVPLGCSAQSGGDWTAHYKTNIDTGHGCIAALYQLVCTNEGIVYLHYWLHRKHHNM